MRGREKKHDPKQRLQAEHITRPWPKVWKFTQFMYVLKIADCNGLVRRFELCPCDCGCETMEVVDFPRVLCLPCGEAG